MKPQVQAMGNGELSFKGEGLENDLSVLWDSETGAWLGLSLTETGSWGRQNDAMLLRAVLVYGHGEVCRHGECC